MKLFEFNLYDKPYKIFFFLDEYLHGGLYVGAMYVDEDGNEDFYGDISINIPMCRLEDKEIVASNDASETVKNMIKAKLLIDTEETVSSGYGIYKKVRLTDKFYEYVKES